MIPSGKKEITVMYETKISTPRWMMYDIPGNIGWILYLTGYGRYLAKSGFTQHMTAGILLTVPVILIVIGIAELVSERIAKLDRILSSVRLFRGFGALTVGGFLGTAFPLLTFKSNFSAVNALMMSAGGILCFVFAGLLLISYKRKN